MSRRLATFVALCLVLGTGGLALAEGRTFKASRFHLATAKLQARLSASAQKNMQAVGQYGAKKLWRDRYEPRGTVFVASVDRDKGTALVMTNAHVAFGRNLQKDVVEFHPGGLDRPVVRAKIRRAVASSLSYDYALLEVELPAAMSKVAPVRFSREQLEAGGGVYQVGYPNLGPLKRWTTSLRQGNQRHPKPEGMTKTIGSGRITDATVKARVAEYGTWTTTVTAATPGYMTNVPSNGGASGSPVFSRSSHAVIGLHNLKDGRVRGLDKQTNTFHWGAAAVPITMVFDQLAKQLQKPGAIPSDAKPQIQRLVDRFNR